MKSIKLRHAKNVLFVSLNIISLRKKFKLVKFVLLNELIDLIFVSEGKLDDSFLSSQFCVKGFYVHRQNTTGTSGGLAGDIGHW